MALTRDFTSIKMTMAGARSIAQHWRTPDLITQAISLFVASSPLAHTGDRSKFQVVLANNTNHPTWMRFLIDIYLKDNPTHPVGHYAYFEKRIFVPARRSEHIDVTYNWREKASFTVDGVRFAPDAFWCGTCRTPGVYFVKAILLGAGGVPSAELNLIQRLVS